MKKIITPKIRLIIYEKLTKSDRREVFVENDYERQAALYIIRTVFGLRPKQRKMNGKGWRIWGE